MQLKLKSIEEISYEQFFERLHLYFESMSTNINKLSIILENLLRFEKELEKMLLDQKI